MTAHVTAPDVGSADPHRAARRSAAFGTLALSLSSLGTALATYAFWTVVARRDGVAAVGTAAAQIATITFIGWASSLNMINIFARFVPVAGTHARRLIAGGYLAAGSTATLAALAFLLTPWADEGTHGITPAVFVPLVTVSTLFVIQDGALLGFGRTTWIPVENVVVGALRIGALPALWVLFRGPTAAVLAWGLAMAVAVGVVGTVVLGRLAPAAHGEPQLPEPRSLRGFVAVESITTVVSSTLSTFLPAIVTFSMGSTRGGYFYVPWMVVAIVVLLLNTVLISAVREAVANPEAARAILLSQLRLCFVVVAVVVVACTAVPELPLAVLGGDFAEHATTLLRWLGLATPGTALGLLFWAFCLIDRRPWPILGLNVFLAGTTAGGVLLFGDRLGLSGIGALYCGAQTLAGLVLLPYLVRRLRRTTTSPSGGSDAQAEG